MCFLGFGMYFRRTEIDSGVKERPMGAERPDRRGFLKQGAALAGGMTLGAAVPAIRQAGASGQSVEDQSQEFPDYSSPELIAYGKRSHHVTSARIPHGGRPSPDDFGLVFHVATPLQDQVGALTPSALHYVGTTRGSFVPDIDPKEHRLLIHGMVDRELIYTMDELRRFPSVTRLHFIECAGNRANRRHTTVQETHGMTSCAEWTGVLLRTLLEEAGVQEGGAWIVAEGVEEVKGASSLPMAKAMDDILVAYGMNGEPLRPQQGFPLRIVVPGFEGILSVKWLRRIKVVDRFYMTYNDYGHLRRDPADAALSYQIGPKSVITSPSGGQQLPGTGFYELRGLAWSGGGRVSRVEVSTDGGESWVDADLRGTPQPMAHTAFSLNWTWDGREALLMSRCTDEIGQVQPTRQQVREYWGVPADQPFSVKGQDNSIQPWRITSDGSVHNALS
jgi:sulfane dehydrogenase subunit SoxC